MEADLRARRIDEINDRLRQHGRPLLTPRQEHLVREFVDNEGNIAKAEDRALLNQLLASNSA